MNDCWLNNPDDDPVQSSQDTAYGGIMLDLCVVSAFFSLIGYGGMLLQ